MKYSTRFYDKSYLLKESYTDKIHEFKIGIHIHIYYIDMLDIFVKYLKESPVYFDLFISVPSESHKNICLDSIVKLNKVMNIDIRVTENIGRDIAPWLIEFSNVQKNYDIFCHLHTKKSLYNSDLYDWGEYLIENLISKKAINNILSSFYLDENMGLIFPPIHRKMFHYTLKLQDIDKENLCFLLDKINMDFSPNNYDNFIFPAGTMLWYRPKALEPIFNMKLTYEDFPKEPISTSGTIAHAIERLIGIVCEQLNYRIKCYITRDSLIDSLFDLYDTYEEKIEVELKLDMENNRLKLYENENNELKLYIQNVNKIRTIFSLFEINKFAFFKVELRHDKLIIVLLGISITLKF